MGGNWRKEPCPVKVGKYSVCVTSLFVDCQKNSTAYPMANVQKREDSVIFDICSCLVSWDIWFSTTLSVITVSCVFRMLASIEIYLWWPKFPWETLFCSREKISVSWAHLFLSMCCADLEVASCSAYQDLCSLTALLLEVGFLLGFAPKLSSLFQFSLSYFRAYSN